MVGLTSSTSGTVTVLGHDVATQRERVQARIGVTLQEAALDEVLTGREFLGFVARVQGRSYSALGAEHWLSQSGAHRRSDPNGLSVSGGVVGIHPQQPDDAPLDLAPGAELIGNERDGVEPVVGGLFLGPSDDLNHICATDVIGAAGMVWQGPQVHAEARFGILPAWRSGIGALDPVIAAEVFTVPICLGLVPLIPAIENIRGRSAPLRVSESPVMGDCGSAAERDRCRYQRLGTPPLRCGARRPRFPLPRRRPLSPGSGG